MSDADVVCGELQHLGRGEVNAVRAPHVAGEPAELFEVFDGRAAVQLPAVLLFLGCLGEMRVQR